MSMAVAHLLDAGVCFLLLLALALGLDIHAIVAFMLVGGIVAGCCKALDAWLRPLIDAHQRNKRSVEAWRASFRKDREEAEEAQRRAQP